MGAKNIFVGVRKQTVEKFKLVELERAHRSNRMPIINEIIATLREWHESSRSDKDDGNKTTEHRQRFSSKVVSHLENRRLELCKSPSIEVLAG